MPIRFELTQLVDDGCWDGGGGGGGGGATDWYTYADRDWHGL